MFFRSAYVIRFVSLSLLCALVASCGLPSVGPNKKDIFAGSVLREGDAFIVAVNDRVTRATAVTNAAGFSSALINAPQIGSDTIKPGDVLSVTVWENVDDGLLAGQGANATSLSEIQVDGSGFIFVPYAGRLRATGNTPEAMRRIITERLEEQTPDPQVEVRRIAGDGATVSLVGSIGAQGVYPIERPTRTLLAMIARAGGVTVEPEVAQITIIRSGRRSQVSLQDLYERPELDIALRAGDRILVEEDTRAYTIMGASGQQARIPFGTPNLNALEAVAQAGGLSPASADPTGVFVMRNEDAAISNAVLAREDLVGQQRMVYVLDLTDPNGIFVARDFAVRDGDTVYITEAPYAQFSRIIASLTSPVAGIGQVSSSVTSD